MFITKEDFKVVASEAALKVMSQADELNTRNAIEEAIEEVAGYLRPTYDCKRIFAATDAERNKQIVMYTADIALYNLVAAMPQRMGSEVRQMRYERAVKWLESVQEGKIVPDLPLATDSQGNEQGGIIAYGNAPDRHSW